MCVSTVCLLCCSLQVGLMRDGQLLAESEPNALINFYRMRVGPFESPVIT